MRYDGVETKDLLKNNSSKMSLLLLCSLVFEVLGYVLYKRSIDNHQWTVYFSVFLFSAVIFCFVLIYKTLLFPKELTLVYGRIDVPEKYFCSTVDLLRHGAVALAVVLYDLICIFRIISGDSI
ncbi:hypothetical protein [Klebsiella electrica]|jgi:hypothetical protein|uniref:Uncharacterized protein n=1 Tax=Klebsiella electrica TaxID=1259973 RepID=A0AAJ5UCA2_9ENTR|nr:hypothetical protein [Klebsiella electrica]WBW59391.1 hypothetical protein OR613_15230 [Klebsiella electrica]WIO45046.1 hypothetical protein P2G42_10710 [Klebsiella electrica]